ncbi:MAG: HAMP domain-containing histidine kinase [Coriobacteriia bacterium]|nr:HAMP domain-containing histidine kinase [Coriobacteriia bacterium]
MKLWQKIFLLTLALVIVVVNTTSLALLSANHRLAIEREQQSALSRHSYLTHDLQNEIVLTQTVERIFMTDEETLSAASEIVERRDSDATIRVTLFRDGTLVYSGRGEPLRAEIDLLRQPDYTSLIIDEGDSTYLLIVSTAMLNDRTYQLVSATDISSSYDLFKAGFDQVKIIGIASALVIAGFLQMLVRSLLTPLRNLSNTTRKIAQGDLDNRVMISGHDEVAEVARDFNTMADSIEHNVTELENLAESRRIFIGNLAHEMKTPLTSILGFADILRVKREVSDDDRINYANVIVSETKRLQGLSGKLMELLALGNLHIVTAKTEVHKLFSELVATLTPIMHIYEMELIVRLPDRAVFINVDQELIKSLVFNLIDNSIKASSPPGSIRLTVTSEQERVTIMVTDEGVGIPEDQIPLLTEPFYMLDKARTRKHGGAGLGLALCSEIAQVHGSQLQISSKPGKGTSVSITLDEVANHD